MRPPAVSDPTGAQLFLDILDAVVLNVIERSWKVAVGAEMDQLKRQGVH